MYSIYNCILDTDSVFLGLTKTGNVPEDPSKNYKGLCDAAFDAIVKPEKKHEFARQRSNWFVLDQSVESKRRPGLLKPEFVSTSGVYIGLAPKSYIVTQDDDVKRGAKGNMIKFVISFKQ